MNLEDLTERIERQGGVATSSSLKKAGFSPGLISYAYDKGYIDKLTRGVYCSLDVYEDDFIVVTSRWSRCIFSHGTALYLHGLSDRVPAALSVTVPRGYNPKGLKSEFPDIEIHRVNEDVYHLGEATVLTPMGNTVRCYSLERSVADLIKQRKTKGADAQLVRDAVSGYFRRNDKDLSGLAALCERLGVRDELQVYLEVL